jgi:hypothetical protein
VRGPGLGEVLFTGRVRRSDPPGQFRSVGAGKIKQILGRCPAERSGDVRGGGEDHQFVVMLGADLRDQQGQPRHALRLVGESLRRKAKRLNARKVSSSRSQGPKGGAGHDGVEARPRPDWQVRSQPRKPAPNDGRQTAEVDVKLVLTSEVSGVDGEREAAGIWGLSAQGREKASRAPGGVEIVRGVARLEPTVLDADHASRRRQDRILRAKRRAQNCVSPRLAGGHVHEEARKRAPVSVASTTQAWTVSQSASRTTKAASNPPVPTAAARTAVRLRNVIALGGPVGA